jgi:hypothetical protein
LETRDWVLNALNRLRGYFGNDMSKRVAVITPYRQQVEEYTTMQYKLRQSSVDSVGESISPDAMATIRTVDSARAAEWDVVLLDLTVTNADRIHDIGQCTTTIAPALLLPEQSRFCGSSAVRCGESL